jgi:hypothetical protein
MWNRLLDAWVDPALREASRAKSDGSPTPKWARRRLRLWNWWNWLSLPPWTQFAVWRRRREIARLEKLEGFDAP